MITYPQPGMPQLPPQTEGFTFCYASAVLPNSVEFEVEEANGTVHGPTAVPVPGPDQVFTMPTPPVHAVVVRCHADFGPHGVIDMVSKPVPLPKYIAYSVYGIRPSAGPLDPQVVAFGVDILSDGTAESI